MRSLTETGYSKLDLNITIDGPMNEEDHNTMRKILLDFLRANGYGVGGKISFVKISTLQSEHFTHTKKDKLDTSV